MISQRFFVPTATFLVGAGFEGVGSFFATRRNAFWLDLVSNQDTMLNADSVLELVSVALTGGSLVLAVWATVEAQRPGIVTSKVLGQPQQIELKNAIDGLFHASMGWFIAFAALFVSYLFLMSFDEAINIKHVFVEEQVSAVGFGRLIEVVGDQVAGPALFYVGVVMLLSGMVSALKSLNHLVPLVTSRK